MRKRDEVKLKVLEILKGMTGGNDTVINEETNVVKVLGLNTEDGLDLACLLEERVGCVVPHNVNPLFNDSRKRGSPGFERSIGDIIELVCKLPDKEVENA